MFGLSVIKIRLSALLADVAVRKSADELAKNRTKSTFLHYAPFLGITRKKCFAFNGDVAVVVNNYERQVTHLPDAFEPAQVAENTANWFSFDSLTNLTNLLKKKSLEDEMRDASVCQKEGENENLLLAFNQKEEIPVKVDTPPDKLDIIKVIETLQIEKQTATTTFTVNVKDMSRVCDYLKRVGDDFVEIKISNDGKTMIFTSKVLQEHAPQVECYLKIRWGNQF